jgi:hypothetical protein
MPLQARVTMAAIPAATPTQRSDIFDFMER